VINQKFASQKKYYFCFSIMIAGPFLWHGGAFPQKSDLNIVTPFLHD